MHFDGRMKINRFKLPSRFSDQIKFKFNDGPIHGEILRINLSIGHEI